MPAHRSPPGQSQRPGLLAPDELRATRGFAMRVAIFAAYAVSPWALGLRPAPDITARLIAAFTMGGSLAMFLAILRNETAGRGRLNRWDEAMAFNGLALLTHLLLPVLPHV